MAVSALSDALTDIEGAVGGLFGATQGNVDTLFTGLGQLSVTLTLLMWLIEGKPAAHGPFIKMIIKIMAIGWLIDVFPILSDKLVTGFANYAGEIAGEGFSLRDPGAVAQFGLTMADPILKRAEELGGFPDFFFALPSIFLYLLAYLGCLVAFFILAIQLFVAWLEWRFMSLAAFICIPFAILGPTSFVAERAIGYVASTGIKMFVLGLVVIAAKLAMNNVEPTAMSLSLALGAVCLSAGICIMGLKAPSAAAGLINGGPGMSAMDALVGLATSAKIGAMAVKAGGGAIGAGLVGAGKVMQGWAGGGGGTAAAAGTGAGMAAAGAGMAPGGAGAGAGAAPSGGGKSYPGRAAAVGAGMVSAGQKLASASGLHLGGAGAAGGGMGAAGGGAGAGAAGAGPNSSWFQAPTADQQNFANSVGVNLQGLNRAQATAALHAAGHGANLASGSASGQMAQAGYAVGGGGGGGSVGYTGGGGGGGAGYSPAAQQTVSNAKATVAGDEAKYAAMAADPAIGNSTAQSLRAMAHHNTAEQTMLKLDRQDPATAQRMAQQMSLVQARVASAQARGRPADVINSKSADDYRNIVNNL